MSETQPYQRHTHPGLNIDDIICILKPRTPAAVSSVQATLLTAPQHILRDADFGTLAWQDGTLRRVPVGTLQKIALRRSAITKSPKQGFKFGRNLRTCDILLTDDRTNTIVSNTHFTIFVDEQEELMIEDCSTNGTLFNDELLLSKDQDGRESTKSRRVLRNGSLVGVSVGRDCELLTFSVRIPQEIRYEDTR